MKIDHVLTSTGIMVFFIGRDAHTGYMWFRSAKPVDSQEMNTSQAPQMCRLTPLSLSKLCTKYLRNQFQFKLNVCFSQLISIAMTPHVPLLMLLVPLTSELDHIALILVDTFL
jgi:hypothetical protein